MQLRGLYIPVTTPFVDDKFAPDKLIFNLTKWNAVELSGYVLFGSSGEAPYLSREERIAILKTARGAIFGNRMLIVGTGYETTTDTIAFTRQAADLGADAVLVLTPNYYKPQMTDDALIRHYESIADRSAIPVIIYNVPVFTGVDMTAAAVKRLAAHERIIGIKDSTPNFAKLIELTQLSRNNFSLLIGNAANYLSGLLVGAAGAILAVANIAAKECLEVHRCVEEKSIDRARSVYLRILPLATKLIGPLGVPVIKAAMDRLGLYGGLPRAPLLPADAKLIVEIEQRLRAAELI